MTEGALRWLGIMPNSAVSALAAAGAVREVWDSHANVPSNKAQRLHVALHEQLVHCTHHICTGKVETPAK